MQSLLYLFSSLTFARTTDIPAVDTDSQEKATNYNDLKALQVPPTLKNAATVKPSTFKSRYTVQDMLGVGGFGHIYACVRNSDGKQVAAKFLRRDKIPGNRWAVDPELGLIPTEA